MKLIAKVGAGFLLSLGGIIILAGVYAPFNSQISRQERISQAIACFLFGIPMTGGGVFLFRGLHQLRQKEARDRLQSIFYQLLKQGNGHITVLHLAMEAQLSAAAAKQYLDQKALEFNTTFNVSEQGVIFYQFNEFSMLPPLDAAVSSASDLSVLPSPAPIVSRSVTPSRKYWTIGSTRDEVLRIQGTPTQITKYESSGEEHFYYGMITRVVFKKGRVAEYHNYDKNLKVFVAPDSS
jgi:hypothetical protein